eukprot:2309138-Lingulodinium_polyedra.AAC.1
MTRFLDPVLARLAKQPRTAALWDFDGPKLASLLRAASEELGVQVTAYQARRSGPSIDLAKGHR